MNYGKEFKSLLQRDRMMYYDKIVGAMTPTNMTPYIIEERQLNISQLDVFKIDDGQIIFLGQELMTNCKYCSSTITILKR
jgi:ATP-dependent Clp protease protease subunit